MSSITIRALTPRDVLPFRALRLEAITKTNLFVSFFPDLPDETKAPVSRFEELLEPKEKVAIFGGFLWRKAY